jgi:hypothetical protein
MNTFNLASKVIETFGKLIWMAFLLSLVLCSTVSTLAKLKQIDQNMRKSNENPLKKVTSAFTLIICSTWYQQQLKSSFSASSETN